MPVLLRMTDNEQLAADRIIVECVGGPRVRVLAEDALPIRSDVPPLLRATECELDVDDE